MGDHQLANLYPFVVRFCIAPKILTAEKVERYVIPRMRIVVMGDDRPFECTEPGCGMRFTNEDHLGVHKAKHEMCLALTSGNTKAGSVITFVADQTPTPTKFLRNCEEIGLFHELSKNPFEEAFKKAFAEGKAHDLHESSPFPGPMCDTEAVLNTPNPGLLLDDESHRREKLTSCKTIVTSAAAVDNYIPLPGPNPEGGSTVTGEGRTVASRSEPSRIPLLSPASAISAIGKPPQRWKSSLSLLKSQSRDEDLDSPLDHDSSQDSMVLGVSTVSSLTTSTSVLNSVLRSTNTMLPESGGICFLQVMIKSVNGEVVPVALSTPVAVVTGASETVNLASSTPGTTLASGEKATKSSSTSALTAPLTSTSSTSMGIASTTKQRLKAAIKQNVQQSVLQNNIQVMSDAVDLVTTQLQQASPGGAARPAPRPSSLLPAAASETSTRLVKLSATEVQLQDADTSTPKKPRLSTDDDPDERRKKFLERNRAAAARCRQKKKVWVNSLEQKAEDLQTANSRLEAEVTQLRGELVHLRTMLQAHKDCPVTRRQRALQGAAAAKTEMQSDDVTSSSPVVITPNAEEIAMAALSTMASRGHVGRGPPVIVTVSEFFDEQP